MKKITVIILLLCFPVWAFSGILFDGVDDVIDCGSNPSLDNFTTYSVSAWINVTDFSSTDGRIAAKSDAGSNNGWSWRIGTTTGLVTLVVGWSGSNGSWTSTAPTAGVWTHIAFTYDTGATANDPVMYLNGVSQSFDADTNPTGSLQADAAFNFLIGNNSDSNRQFNGQITEVSYWSVILTQAEVTRLANSRIKRMPFQIQPSSQSLYVPMDDEEDGSNADGDTFLDLSSNTNNGTGSDGANNTGLTAKAEEVLSY